VRSDAFEARRRSRWIEDRPAPRVVPQCVAGPADKDQCVRLLGPCAQVPREPIGDEGREPDRGSPARLRAEARVSGWSSPSTRRQRVRVSWLRSWAFPVIGRNSPDDPALAQYWANRRRKQKPPQLAPSWQHALRDQHGQCPLCREPLLYTDRLPDSLNQCETWHAAIRKAMIHQAITEHHSGRTKHRLVHAHCARRHPDDRPHGTGPVTQMPARPRGLLEPCAATSGPHGSEEGVRKTAPPIRQQATLRPLCHLRRGRLPSEEDRIPTPNYGHATSPSRCSAEPGYTKIAQGLRWASYNFIHPAHPARLRLTLPGPWVQRHPT